VFDERNEMSQNYPPFVLEKQTTDVMNIFFLRNREENVDEHSF